MSDTKHSPTPWKYVHGHTNDSTSTNLGAIRSADGYNVAEVCADAGEENEPDPHKANAAHIVKCVNLHDELVEACKAALVYPQPPLVEKALRAVITKATQ